MVLQTNLVSVLGVQGISSPCSLPDAVLPSFTESPSNGGGLGVALGGCQANHIHGRGRGCSKTLEVHFGLGYGSGSGSGSGTGWLQGTSRRRPAGGGCRRRCRGSKGSWRLLDLDREQMPSNLSASAEVRRPTKPPVCPCPQFNLLRFLWRSVTGKSTGECRWTSQRSAVHHYGARNLFTAPARGSRPKGATGIHYQHEWISQMQMTLLQPTKISSKKWQFFLSFQKIRVAVI